jgi:hypothetical protein
MLEGPEVGPVKGIPLPTSGVGLGDGVGAGNGATTARVEYHANTYVTPALNVIGTGPEAKL